MVTTVPEVSLTRSPSVHSTQDQRATLRPHAPPQVIKSGETPGSDQDPRQPLSSDDATTSSPPQHLNHRGRTTLSRFPWVSRTSGEKLGTVFMGGNNQHLKSRKSQGLVFEHQEHPSTPFKEGDSESNITTPSPGASAPAPKRRKSKALVQGFWSRLRTYPFLSPTDSSSAGKKNRLGDPARAQADSRVPGVPVADDQVHPSVEQPESPVPTFVGTHTDPRLEPVGSLGQMVERAEMGQHWALGTTTTPSNPGQNTPTMIMSESPSQLACLSFLPPSTPSLPVTPASLTSRKPRPAGSSTASTPSTQPPTTPYQVLAPSSFAFPGRPHTRSLWGVVRPKTSGQSLLGGSIAAAAPSLMASTVISCRDDDEDRSVDVKEHDPGTEIVGAGSVSPQRTEKSQGFTDANSRNHITLQTNVWYSNVLEPLVPKPIGTRSIRAGERSDEGVLQVVHELVRAVPNAHGAWVIEASVGTQQPRAEGPRVVSAEMLDSHLETKLQLVRNMEVDVHACVQCALAKHELDYMVCFMLAVRTQVVLLTLCGRAGGTPSPFVPGLRSSTTGARLRWGSSLHIRCSNTKPKTTYRVPSSNA